MRWWRRDEPTTTLFLEALVTGELRMFMPGSSHIRKTWTAHRDSLDSWGEYYTRARTFASVPRHVPRVQLPEIRWPRSHRHRWEMYPRASPRCSSPPAATGCRCWVTRTSSRSLGTRRNEFLWRHWSSVLQARAAASTCAGDL
jgi:hypothetical protein